MLEIMFASLDLSNNREEYRLLCVDVLLKKYVFNLDTCTGIMPDIRTLYILHRTLTLIVKVNIIYTLAK